MFNLLGTILRNRDLTRFGNALSKSRIPQMGEQGPFTVFAPTNSACDDLADMEGDELKQTILSHVADGVIDEDGARDICKDCDVRIMGTLTATNGVIYIVNGLMVKPRQLKDEPTVPVESEAVLSEVLSEASGFPVVNPDGGEEVTIEPSDVGEMPPEVLF